MKSSFSLNLLALLGALFTASISSATAIPTSHDNPVCEPRTHVVIDSSTVEIYNSTIHGTDGHLRLFKMIPLACPDRYIRTLPRELSFRTDLQLRDTRTELSTIIYGRGLFTWAKSLLKFVPIVNTAIGIFGLADCVWEWAKNGATVPGGLACVLGGITTAYGIGELLQARAAASLATAATNAHELQTIVDSTFSEVGTQTTFGRRANPRVEAAVTRYHSLIQNLTLPGVRHHTSGKDVTLWDIARANSTHPITVLHSNRAFKANYSHAVDVWSSVGNPGSGIPRLHFMVPFPYGSNTTSTTISPELRGRQAPPPACPGAEINDLGQGSEKICHPNGIPPEDPNAPDAMYYGFDLYGTKAQVDEFQDDLGSTFDDQNGFVPSIEAMANDIVAADAWDTCVCQMTQNTWISTGSIQMSWDNTYNGYSPCFNPNCDNDAMI
ncbi:hypothetical protein MVEN_00470100 [Mycena venus]|uniref:Uncharacterized protein n=1 Tax=Mycena venus TaxID=2733690 RepID=A0A8H6YW04_9AGAR|nr:hypothetical protein MVEN_00470100 [Mycena venus]